MYLKKEKLKKKKKSVIQVLEETAGRKSRQMDKDDFHNEVFETDISFL